jgi:thiamine pyrophosphate-dependent acetolactate synthase large subunit-like protein
MKVSEAIGQTLARMGTRQVFGVVGSGNFRATNALLETSGPTSEKPKFTATRHEMGAVCMADAYTRATDQLSVVTVHQGCGLSNALTGLGEAAKAHTPLVVISGDTPGGEYGSNFWVDQDKVVEGMGAIAERVHSAARAVDDTIRAVTRAVVERKPVVLSMPLDIQESQIPTTQEARLEDVSPPVLPSPASASPASVSHVVELLTHAERPVILAGRGAQHAVAEIRQLAKTAGALLTTSAVGRGLFNDDEWHMDAMGGFATDGAAALTDEADVLLVFGAALNRWTTRSGELLKNKTVIQVDDTPTAFGLHYPVDLTVLGDSQQTAQAMNEELASCLNGVAKEGYRTQEVNQRLKDSLHWRDQDFEDTTQTAKESQKGLIDPRVLSNILDDILPMERVVVPDGGNFNAYPAMHFRVPDNAGYSLSLGFQSIGLAVSTAIGASFGLPDRIAIAGVGDGGFMMSHVELDTAVRHKIPLVVVVYNDDAYSAEVHHFSSETDNLDTVVFPETDIAAIARGYGCDAITVRGAGDLDAVSTWVDGPRDRPLVIDAKITSFPSWVLAHSFGENE